MTAAKMRGFVSTSMKSSSGGGADSPSGADAPRRSGSISSDSFTHRAIPMATTC